MTTRQARSNAKVRAARTASGRCRDCGVECDTYRCDGCNAKRAADRKGEDGKRRW